MRASALAALTFALAVLSCTPATSARATQDEPQAKTQHQTDLASVLPEDEQLDSKALLELTEWIRDQHIPVFSLLISRNGRVVYEMYTSHVRPDDAHFQMSVTKSVVSALIGIAIDRGYVGGPDAPITTTIPRRIFGGDANFARFQLVTVRHVLGMSALDAPDVPRFRTPEALALQRRFWSVENRVALALEQPLLAKPGVSFQYNDVTPMLATGVLQYATGRSALEFAEENLFKPMKFRNYEWMHQDPAGIDNGGYGLRLRPVDMQKFGILYLNSGRWEGRQLVASNWVALSFSPWNRTRTELREPNYGWFWWTRSGGPAGTVHSAVGWKGQRIAVVPDRKIVVTMTACIQDDSEVRVFNEVIDRFLVRALRSDATMPRDTAVQARLAAAVDRMRDYSVTCPGGDDRMVPSATPKGKHVSFRNP
jgi:CubicO group peptidase (beta-lactamase class C family)